jgi:glutaredoxin-like protein
MIDKNTAKKGKEYLSVLTGKVTLVVFTQETECMYCEQNRELAQDVAALSDLIELEVYDFVKDKDTADRYGIDKIPAITVVSESRDHGMRFFGIPSGYEFTSLLEAVRIVSTQDHGLSPETVKKLEGIDSDVHIQVFVTPTCPYCPRSVVLAHKLALASDHIRADMVESMEFPHLANKYSVMGVPRSVFNEKDFIEGAVPEKLYVDKIMEIVNRR